MSVKYAACVSFSLTSNLVEMVRIQVFDFKYGGRPSEKYMDVQWLDGDCWGIFPMALALRL